MTLLDVKKSIVSKLKAKFPTIKVVAHEVEEGFTKPAFFIQMIPFGIISNNKYHKTKSINIDIHYFSDTETHIDNLNMIDSLEDTFLPSISILDRNFTIENINTKEDGGILHFEFDISFTDSFDVTETHELMQELELKEEY